MQIRPAHVATTYLPVYGEHHLIYAPLDFVLRLQVSHALCRFSVDRQDHVSNTQVGLGSFTSRGDLQHRRRNLYKTETFWTIHE